MATSFTTLVLKDSTNTNKSVQAIDLSGAGTGPFIPTHLLVDFNGNSFSNANPFPITGAVSVSNFPSTQAVTGPATDVQLRATPLPVSGSISVGNFPATQTITGSVSVGNFPSTQAVTGPATDAQLRATPLPVSGSLSIGNFPATQAISGSVNVGNFPATQTVAGTVTANVAFPTTQAVSAISLPLPTGAATSAKQAAPGSAGTPSVDVITVQGTTGMLALKTDSVVQATSVSRSGTITTGGTAQVLMPANTSRRGFVIQNQSTTDLFINGLATATTDQNSLRISAGDFYETQSHHVGAGSITVIGATTGQAFYCREF